MKLTLPQLRKLVESTVKDVMKSKRSLKEEREDFGPYECPECGSDDIDRDGEDIDGTFYFCNSCLIPFDATVPGADLDRSKPIQQPDVKTGGMKASLDRHVKESKMRTRRR